VLDGQTPRKYTCIDLMPELCSVGCERFSKLESVDIKFIPGEMLSAIRAFKDGCYDFVVAAGALDIVETNSVEHWQFMRNVITEMYRVASRAIVLAVQSAGAKEKKDCEFYSDPAWFIREMIERFGFNVVLDHSFAPHYMVVVVYKREYPWRELNARCIMHPRSGVDKDEDLFRPGPDVSSVGVGVCDTDVLHDD